MKNHPKHWFHWGARGAEPPLEQGTPKGRQKFHLTALALDLSGFCAKKEQKGRERDAEKGGLRGQRLLHPSPKPRLAHRCRELCQVPTLCLTCCSPPGHQQKENNLFLLLPALLLSCFKPFCFVQEAGSAQAWDHLPFPIYKSQLWSSKRHNKSCKHPLQSLPPSVPQLRAFPAPGP